jgi:hypothetical protein
VQTQGRVQSWPSRKEMVLAALGPRLMYPPAFAGPENYRVFPARVSSQLLELMGNSML